MNYSAYPGGIDDFQNVVDNQDYVQAVHVNRLNEAVNKIEAELGTYPSGTYNDVKTRLDNTKIGDLSDVTISSPAQNNVITYASGSSTWENRELNLDDIPDGSISKLGQDCSPTGSPTFSNVNSGTMVLEGGTNDTTLQAGTPTESVTYTLPADDGSSGQVLATDGSGNLSWASAVPGSESLNDLTDVTITTPSDNQILKYDSSATQWQNESLTADDIPDGSTNVIITSSQETNFETAYTHSQLTTGNPHDVTAAQAGAIADADDSVKDGNIDWGTGANQVSLDNVPDGSTSKLGQDCSATGSPTFSSVNGLTLTENTAGFSAAGGTATEKTLTVSETATIDQDLQQSASPTFAGATIGGALDLNGNLDMSTGVYDLVVKGNESVALEIKDDTETYITIDSTDSNEKVKIQKTLEIGGSYTLPITDGSASQVLTTNGNGVAGWQNPASTVTQLNDLSDVTIATPSDNQILKYDSSATQWQNESLTADDIPDGATNVIITSTQEGHYDTAYTHSQLTTGNPHDVTAAQAGAIADTNDSVKDSNIDWGTGVGQVSLDSVPDGSTSKLGQDCSTTGSPAFNNVNSGTVVLEGGTYDTTLQAGTPTESVTYTLPADDGSSGQVLATDGSGNLSWASAPPSSESLGDLTDVTITSLADDQFLRYNSTSSQWENESVTLDDVPNGTTSKLGQDCSTTGSPTFSSVNGIGLTENTTGFSAAGGSSTEKTLTVSETATIDQDLQQSASPEFSGLNLAGNLTMSNGADRTVAVSQATSGNGNSLTVKAGDAYGTGNTEGGKLILQAGAGGDGEDAEDGEIILKSETFFDSVNLTGTAVFGRGIAGTDTAGQDLLILGGEPDEDSAQNLDGGDIYITGGPSVNSGTDGNVILGYNPEESTAQGKVNFHNAYEFPTTDGTDGQVLTTDGSGNVSWESGGGGGGSLYEDIDIFDDFIGGYLIGSQPWIIVNYVSPTGSQSNHPGVMTVNTSTSSTMASYAYLNPVYLEGGEIFSAAVNIPILSTAGEEFIVRIGLGTAQTTDFVRGVYFMYDRLTSVNWIYCTADANVRTQTASAVAVDAASWIRLKTVVNSDATSIEYFVNEVSLGSITTNIPAYGALVIQIVKSAGTTKREILTDYIRYKKVMTTPR